MVSMGVTYFKCQICGVESSMSNYTGNQAANSAARLPCKTEGRSTPHTVLGTVSHA